MSKQKQFFYKYLLYTLLCNHKKRDKYKQKFEMFKNNTLDISEDTLNRVDIRINGKNNKITIKDSANIYAKIIIFGNNNTIYIDDRVSSTENLIIAIGQEHFNFGPVYNCSVKIGKDTSFESAVLTIKNSNSSINIGEKCMFAFNVALYHTDSHPIFDLKTNNIINKVKTMSIGNHVWIGAHVSILKNTIIPNDCIIGWGSVVSGKFIQTNCIIAGNSAKIVKTGITWDANGSKGYVQNEK